MKERRERERGGGEREKGEGEKKRGGEVVISFRHHLKI